MRSVSVGRRPAITSSSSRSFGSVASARATSRRLRSGSVSAAGQLPALVEQIEPPQHLDARGASRAAGSGVAQQRADHDVVLDRERRKRPHDLEGAADAAAADLVGRQPVDALARERDACRRPARSTPAIMLNSVVLPAPFGPITAKIDALRHREADVVDRAQAAEALRDVRHLQERGHVRPPAFRAGRGATAARSAARCRPAGPSPPAAGRRRRTPAWRPACRGRGACSSSVQRLRQPGEQERAEDRPEQRADAADDRRRG